MGASIRENKDGSGSGSRIPDEASLRRTLVRLPPMQQEQIRFHTYSTNVIQQPHSLNTTVVVHTYFLIQYCRLPAVEQPWKKISTLRVVFFSGGQFLPPVRPAMGRFAGEKERTGRSSGFHSPKNRFIWNTSQSSPTS